MIFSLIQNLPIKRPSVQKTLHFSAIRLVCSFRPTNRQYMAIYGVSTTNVYVILYFIGSKRVEHGQKLKERFPAAFSFFFSKKRTYFGHNMTSKFEIY